MAAWGDLPPGGFRMLDKLNCIDGVGVSISGVVIVGGC